MTKTSVNVILTPGKNLKPEIYSGSWPCIWFSRVWNTWR